MAMKRGEFEDCRRGETVTRRRVRVCVAAVRTGK